MISLKLSQIAQAVDGKLTGEDIEVSSVTTDSRVTDGNDLFLALKGEKFDAHDFVASAVANGARALVVSRKPDTSVPYILVDDTRIALGRLGAYLKSLLAPKTVGITGTCGKTSVKDMLSSILRLDGSTLATDGNFNNDIGVPLTLLRLKPEHKYAVVEMGTNHPGEISYTTNLVRPDICLINNIGYAHIEGFGSLEGVFRAKMEVYEGLAADGTAVFSRDSEFFEQFASADHHRHVSFGLTPEADVYAENPVCREGGCYEFTLNAAGNRETVRLRVPGIHNVSNACAAAAAAWILGVSSSDIRQGLCEYKTFRGRLLVTRHNAVTLIDDTYNASVNAVFAAINTLSEMEGRKIMILGEMGELGDMEEELHREVGRKFKQSGIDLLLTLGELTRYTVQEAGENATFLTSKNDLYNTLRNCMVKGEKITVLVKGAHYMKMNEVADYIREHLC